MITDQSPRIIYKRLKKRSLKREGDSHLTKWFSQGKQSTEHSLTLFNFLMCEWY